MIERDDDGRPLVRYCPLCGEEDPGGIWGAETVAAILECSGCGANITIDVGPEVK